MTLLLRCCVSTRKILFSQEVTTCKRLFTCSTYNTVKKHPFLLQIRNFSTENDEDTESELIYTGPMSKKVRNVKLFSILSSIGSIIAQPFLYMKMLEEDNTANIALVFAALNLLAITSPLFVHTIGKRYVIEMYHNREEDNYTAVVYSFFCKRKEITFTPLDVVEPPNSMFTTCVVKNNPLLFDQSQFINPKHYLLVMGYNRPVDLEVEKLKMPSPVNQLPLIERSRREKEDSNKEQ